MVIFDLPVVGFLPFFVLTTTARVERFESVGTADDPIQMCFEAGPKVGVFDATASTFKCNLALGFYLLAQELEGLVGGFDLGQLFVPSFPLLRQPEIPLDLRDWG